jgi:class 3 adenylate cyclase
MITEGYGNLVALHAALNSPQPPRKLTAQYQDKVFERILNRTQTLTERVNASTQGRVIPDADSLAIGESRRFECLSVLFLDICGFSKLPNWTESEQKKVLQAMNVFMTEMLNIIRDYEGVFEKNTGDGLMAYFGEGAKTVAEAVRPAVEAAVTMHYVNDNLAWYFLRKYGCDPITFRVGIDVGPITIAKVAIPGGTHGSVVAIGDPANIACKIMKLIPDGGICVGDKVYDELPNNWKNSCAKVEESTGFVYRQNQAPYPGWTLNYRTPCIPMKGGGI